MSNTGLACDLIRVGALARAGVTCALRTIPADITPQNRVIVGLCDVLRKGDDVAAKRSADFQKKMIGRIRKKYNKLRECNDARNLKAQAAKSSGGGVGVCGKK